MLPSESKTAMGADEFHPVMRWGAIIGGWLVATAIASMLYAAGLALGFSALDASNAEATAKGIGMGTAGWMVLTWTASLFLGAMFASWFDGRSDPTMGALHGVTVWGLSIAASGLLLALGLAQVAQGGAAIAGAGAAGAAAKATAASGPAGGATDEAIAGLQAQLSQRVAQSSSSAAVAPGQASAPPVGASRALDRSGMAAVAAALLKGRTDDAKALLAANTSMPQAEVDQTLQAVSADVERYKAKVKAAADATARYTAAAMGIAFFSALFGLVAAGLGGWLGAGHIRRVHHLRRYETAAVASR